MKKEKMVNLKNKFTAALKRVFKKPQKGGMLTHLVSNIVIVAVILGLYIGCIEAPAAVSASAPIYKGGTSEKNVSLMINVYWGDEYLDGMLKVLDSYNAKCTFFVGGSWAAKSTPMLSKISENHEIGNHGYLHKDHKVLNKKQNLDEISLCHKLVEETTGKKMNLFAPPSGSIGNAMLEVCKELDYKVIMWSKDTIDWRDKDYDLVFKRATSKLENGDLILMHPTEHTLKALPAILDFYKNAGYNVVCVSDNLSSSVDKN